MSKVHGCVLIVLRCVYLDCLSVLVLWRGHCLIQGKGRTMVEVDGGEGQGEKRWFGFL